MRLWWFKKNVAFTLLSFAVLKWDDCLSVQVPFELPVQILVQQLLPELEENLLDQNVNELIEFELSRMYMKQSSVKPISNHIFKLVWYLVDLIYVISNDLNFSEGPDSLGSLFGLGHQARPCSAKTMKLMSCVQIGSILQNLDN